MSDLIVGFGLVLVFEGLLWALAPQLGVKLLESAKSTPEQVLRRVGWLAVAIGGFLVWIVRG